jgi:two-component system response regulator PilR (NtrC family)
VGSTQDVNTASQADAGALGCPPLPDDLQAWLDQQEREILVRALKESGFNRTATAARLGISLRQIRYRIARLNIAVPNDPDFQEEIG